MGSPYPGHFPDPAKCRLLSVNEKRELVRELSKFPGNAPEQLQEWTRREIVEILCVELGRERKYTGLSKQRMLDHLFRVVNGKSSDHRKHLESNPESNASNLQSPSKRQRKDDSSSPLPVIGSTPRTADQPLQEDSCGLSCHLECALKDERSGILQSGQSKKLDGDYYCIHCGKQNNLLGCWKKQLLIAKNARRLDVLCHRIFLSRKILISTEKYLILHEIVDTAMKKLEAEVGPITGIPDMGQGLVGRLAVGAEVQKLCTCAIDTLQSMFSGALTADLQIQRSSMVPSNFIKFEDISHESATVVFDLDVCPTLSQGLTCFYLWHRKAGIGDYPSNPTGIILMPLTTFVVTRLAPCTYYVFKVVAFTNSKEFGSWEVRTRTICCPKEQSTKSSMPVVGGTDPNNGSPKANSCGLSNPSSEGVESNNGSTIYADLNKSPECVVEYCENPDILHSDKVSHHCNKSTSNSQTTKMGEVGVSKVDELEEAPGVSASALDEDEEPKSAAQAALLRKPTNLMVYNRGTLKQNLLMIFPGPEIAPHTNTGNKLVAPPEYPCSFC